MKTRKINKISKSLFMATLIAVAMVTATSCSKDGGSNNNGTGSGLTGWYADLSLTAKQSDFNAINTAINNHELLTSYTYNKYYATYDLFIGSDGLYRDSDPHFGRLRFSINYPLLFIHIIDDSTLQMGSGMLYVEDGSGTYSYDMLYKLYAGPIFENMAYYGRLNYYTYVKTDNKIIVSNGDIYTVTNSGLIQDGTSSLLSKYDPSKRY